MREAARQKRQKRQREAERGKQAQRHRGGETAAADSKRREKVEEK